MSRPDFDSGINTPQYTYPMTPDSTAPVRHRRAASKQYDDYDSYDNTHPEGIERTRVARRDINTPDPDTVPIRKASPLPKWLIIAIISAVVIAFGGFIWHFWMQGELRSIHQQKIDAYESLINSHPLPENYAPLVEKYAAEYNLQPAYVAAIIQNESSWRPQVSSGVGALGLMQLMKGTAKEINDILDVQGYVFETAMTDPETNIRFGCYYLNKLSRHYDGDPILTTCAYHAGRANVDTWLLNPAYSADGKTLSIESIPMDDTKTYVGRVIRDYAIYDALYYRNVNDAETAIDPPDDLSVSRTAERSGQ